MLRIAICDDKRQVCSQMEQMLADLAEDKRESWQIETYPSAEILVQALRSGEYYDLLFLDIELPNIDGIEVGRIIRDELDNEATKIIFISGNESYAMDLFAVRPVDFIIKPVERQKLTEVMDTVLSLIDRECQFFEYKNGHQKIKVLLKDILYFESAGKKVYILTKQKRREFYGKLSDVEAILGARGFLFIHKSYLINYSHVIEYRYESATMSNKVTLPISQKRRSAVRNWIMKTE